ncbi:hypothetical protein B0H10DRAFT_1948474 [Mycena sp. CBHHK59/15]|nr:hypothetical protein B0H10DRAFT_1948474 [Mycena sp. CBHHK59/15]
MPPKKFGTSNKDSSTEELKGVFNGAKALKAERRRTSSAKYYEKNPDIREKKRLSNGKEEGRSQSQETAMGPSKAGRYARKVFMLRENTHDVLLLQSQTTTILFLHLGTAKFIFLRLPSYLQDGVGSDDGNSRNNIEYTDVDRSFDKEDDEAIVAAILASMAARRLDGLSIEYKGQSLPLVLTNRTDKKASSIGNGGTPEGRSAGSTALVQDPSGTAEMMGSPNTDSGVNPVASGSVHTAPFNGWRYVPFGPPPPGAVPPVRKPRPSWMPPVRGMCGSCKNEDKCARDGKDGAGLCERCLYCQMYGYKCWDHTTGVLDDDEEVWCW